MVGQACFTVFTHSDAIIEGEELQWSRDTDAVEGQHMGVKIGIGRGDIPVRFIAQTPPF
jgi:hypothetical protein